MRGAMSCHPTQLWNQLSPAWQTRIRADLTALFQEVIDAQRQSRCSSATTLIMNGLEFGGQEFSKRPDMP